jgi:hypothetical protein
LVRIPEKNIPLGMLGLEGRVKFKMHCKEIMYESLSWIELIQDWDQ